jgi:hypothetical protein
MGPVSSWHLRRLVRRHSQQQLRGESLTNAEAGVFSQNGEDGVIQELLRRIGVRTPYFVEFGAGRGEQANCVLLADHYGWNGLFIEADAEQYAELKLKYQSQIRVQTMRARVTADNIETLLREADVPREFDLLSIDTDGNDFWIWQAIRSFNPRVIVIEYNGNLDLDEQLVMPQDDGHQWDGTDYFGASLGAYRTLAAEKGYKLVHTERTGTNAFFVPDCEMSALADLAAASPSPANYFCRGLRLPSDPGERPFVDLVTGEPVNAQRHQAD